MSLKGLIVFLYYAVIRNMNVPQKCHRPRFAECATYASPWANLAKLYALNGPSNGSDVRARTPNFKEMSHALCLRLTYLCVAFIVESKLNHFYSAF